MKTTAVASCHKGTSNTGQTALTFTADYSDERNKEWAKYTPVLNIQMSVLDIVAEGFKSGGRYLVTFELAE